MRMMTVKQPFERTIVPISTGVSLEVDLFRPRETCASLDGKKLAVCLHPWSWLGGRKDDPVLLSLTGSLLKANYNVLRYNSRSVGKSTGWSSFTGFNEAQDLEAIVQWAIGKTGHVSSLVLIGYSHGSLITSLHPILPAPIKTSHVLLSYPLGPRGWLTLFRSSHYQQRLENLLKDERSNVAVIYGDRDEFTSISDYSVWADKLKALVPLGSNRFHIAELQGATHFWTGEAGEELVEVFERWLP